MRLRLLFDDVDAINPRFVHPTLSDAQAIIDFARRVEGAEGKLIIHCQAGVSRSTAAAMIVLRTWWGPGSEEQAAEHVFSVRPMAVPNELLLRHGDDALKTEGALLRALLARVPAYKT